MGQGEGNGQGQGEGNGQGQGEGNGQGEGGMALVAIAAQCGALIGGTVASILALIFGILILVPADPFTEQNIGVGVTLIVLSVCGIFACGGAVAGACVFGAVCAPCACCIEAL